VGILENIALHDGQTRPLEDGETANNRIGVETDALTQREAIKRTQATDFRKRGAAGFVRCAITPANIY
jgi:hypothetical protein